MTKSYAVLQMYDSLLEGKTLNIADCMANYNISVPTFRRYISLLRAFLVEQHAISLLYDRSNGTYYLEKPFSRNFFTNK
ncbi:MAG: hypothetical protein J6Q55_00150 [Clostridia bacterium]|nr:hypothetical protein [Clostridia bacterium]